MLKNTIKSLLTLGVAAGFMIGAASANATENRITVNEVHDFIDSADSAINNANINVGRHFLDRVTADNAIFENRVTFGSAYNPYVKAYYGQGFYARYPYVPTHTSTSYRALTKWQHINLVEEKKLRVPGYTADMEITNINIRPYGESAVVDIDLKEYSLAYTPYTPALAQRVLHSNSKCKAYLAKDVNDDVMLTRLDCNTNTTLPF